MLVKFIAHAGIFLKEKGGIIFKNETSALIDPWFNDSTVEKPIIEAIHGHNTIDFQIPKSEENIKNYSPDLILLSHFHAHHAPFNDIVSLIENSSKKIIIGHPDLGENNVKISDRFKKYSHVELRPSLDGGTFVVGNLHIKAFKHTSNNHLAWQVTSPSGTVLHIADSGLNKDRKKRIPDEIWNNFKNLKPDLLFISAGGNSLRKEKDGVRYIHECTGLSPAQGAEIVQLINPKVVSLIGIYNHSIWKNRLEFIPPNSYIEEFFYWALGWLSPHVKAVFARPSHVYGIADSSLATHVDTYIE